MLERVEEEPRAVFLHLFRVGHFLSFSAFSGCWVELFTVPFRRVQRFYAKGEYGRNRNNHLWGKNGLCLTNGLIPTSGLKFALQVRGCADSARNIYASRIV